MNQVIETCRCGHDVATHFLDIEREGEYYSGGVNGRGKPKVYRGKCLGLNCNDCKRYEEAAAKK